MFRFSTLLLVGAAALAQVSNQANPNDSERLSDLATRMLERAAQARKTIAAKDNGQARHLVDEALQNITAMEIMRPNAPQPMNVTLYTESVQISVNQRAPQGSADRAQQSGPEVVHDATGESTRVWVNVTQAKQHLLAAKKSLDAGDAVSADGALEALEKEDLKAESIAGDMPLLKARQNLWLALSYVRQQKFQEAAAPLEQASAALGQYAGSKSRYASDAGKLKADIDKMASTIAQNHTGAEKKINDWWADVDRWFTPMTAPAK